MDEKYRINAVAPETEYRLDLEYEFLAAMLGRIDVLLARSVISWQEAGRRVDEGFLGTYVSDADAVLLLRRPLGANWGETVSLSSDTVDSLMKLDQKAVQRLEGVEALCRVDGYKPRLMQLAERFKLDRFDLDVLLICLAPTLDLRYERLFVYLQDSIDRRRPSVELVLNLLCSDRSERFARLSRLSQDAPLFRQRLVQRAESGYHRTVGPQDQELAVDDTVLAWLLGEYRPHDCLQEFTSLHQVPDVMNDAVIVRDVDIATLDTLDDPLIALYGPDTEANVVTARLFAHRRSLPLLHVDLAHAQEGRITVPQAIQLVLRDALLIGAIPLLVNWDTCLVDQVPSEQLLAEICQHPGPAIFSSRARWQPRGIRQRRIRWIHVPLPTARERHLLWQHFLDASELGGSVPKELVEAFRLSSGQIRDAVQAAMDTVPPDSTEVGAEDLMLAARSLSNPRLAELAHKVTPRYGWNDIVLPPDQRAQLREMVNMVRQQTKVLEEWGLGQKLVASRGICALFSGPPGTGKTMAAEIIAGELGLDLYKIDLSAIVSKYIGETEKNLERIFAEAQNSNAILFFDEADALFGKRSEVRDSHDRYANIEVSYLLQRMEAFDGVSILATNLRSNLDPAFARRLQFTIDFPFPDAEQRRQIWETLWPKGLSRGEDVDCHSLAEQHRLSGGSIRNVLVGAAYLAVADGQQVTGGILERSLRREMQKLGRLLS